MIFYVIKHTTKRRTMRLYKVNDYMVNTSSNNESDRSLASEIEQNALKSLKVVTMSELKTRFYQLLSSEGIVASNYKSLYLQKKTRNKFRK